MMIMCIGIATAVVAVLWGIGGTVFLIWLHTHLHQLAERGRTTYERARTVVGLTVLLWAVCTGWLLFALVWLYENSGKLA